jgi:hypothetical protein
MVFTHRTLTTYLSPPFCKRKGGRKKKSPNQTLSNARQTESNAQQSLSNAKQSQLNANQMHGGAKKSRASIK